MPLVDGVWCEEDEIQTEPTEPEYELDDWEPPEEIEAFNRESLEREADQRLEDEEEVDTGVERELEIQDDRTAAWAPKMPKLKPVGTDPLRKASTGLTAAQRRLRDEFGEIARSDAPAKHEKAYVREVIGRTNSSSIGRGTASAVKGGPARASSLDTLENVTAEIENVLRSSGLTLDSVRRDAFPSHSPTTAHKALRAGARAALMPTFESGRTRTLMAEALGCSVRSLERLMR